MAKPNINKDALMNALVGIMGEGKNRARDAMLDSRNMPKVEEALAKLVSGHAGRMGGELNSATITDLLRQGGANFALPGAGVGALTGFFAAPGQEEENLLGIKKYRAPTIGDRLMSALTYGAGGAAVGAGVGAVNTRSMAKKLLESGASPDLVQSYIGQTNLMPQIESTILNTAQRGGRGAAAAALGPNARWRNPQDMANSLSSLHASIMTMAGERGMRDRNVIAGATMLANSTGLPIATIMKDPKAVSQAINRSAMTNFTKFDEKSMGAMETVINAIKNGTFAGEAPRTPGRGDYLKAFFQGPGALENPQPGVMGRLKDWMGRGEGAMQTDDFVRDLTRGDISNLSRQNLQVQGIDEKGKNKLVESIKQLGKTFDPNKGALPSQALTGRAYSGMLADDFNDFGKKLMLGGAAGTGLLGAGALGTAALVGLSNRNQNNANQPQDLHAAPVPTATPTDLGMLPRQWPVSNATGKNMNTIAEPIPFKKESSVKLSRADRHPLMQQLKALK